MACAAPSASPRRRAVPPDKGFAAMLGCYQLACLGCFACACKSAGASSGAALHVKLRTSENVPERL